MSVYVRLAAISGEKHQQQVRDRFLLLGAVEACRAGWPDVAAGCRQKLVESNPAHLAGRFPTMADALRDHDFQQLVAHWERYCPFEKAEALLRQVDAPMSQAPEETLGSALLKLLGD